MPNSVPNEVGVLLFDKRTVAGGADVVFEVGHEDHIQIIWAHSVVMAAVSPYMEALLKGQFREAKERRVRLPDVTVELFEQFLELLYKGRVSAMFPKCFLQGEVNRDQDGCDSSDAVSDFHTANFCLKRAGHACLQNNFPRFACFVHVARINVSNAVWKELLKSSGCYQDLQVNDGVYSTRSRTTGSVQEAWIGCRRIQQASAIAGKLSRSPLMSKSGHVDIVTHAERLLDIAVLLDRFRVSHHDQWILDQLQRYVGWRELQPCMFPMLVKIWNTPLQSFFVKMCEERCLNHWTSRPHHSCQPNPWTIKETTAYLNSSEIEWALSRIENFVGAVKKEIDEWRTWEQVRGIFSPAVRLQLLKWILQVVNHCQKTLRKFDDSETGLLYQPLDQIQENLKEQCLESLDGLTEAICEAMQDAVDGLSDGPHRAVKRTRLE